MFCSLRAFCWVVAFLIHPRIQLMYWTIRNTSNVALLVEALVVGSKAQWEGLGTSEHYPTVALDISEHVLLESSCGISLQGS